MSILENVLQRFGYVSQSQFQTRISEAVKMELDKNSMRWLGDTADAQQWTLADPSIYANQADLYRLSPILGTALDILSGDMGTSKFNVKRMFSEEEREVKNHPLEQLLRNPNPLDSGMELMQYTTSNYKLNGNSIWWLNKANETAEPDEIWTIPFSMIKPIPDKRLYLKYYEYYPGNGKAPITFETWEIVHFKTYNPNNRYVGLSPIESLAVTITGDLAMRKTNTTTYANYGGAPASILAFKDFVNNEAWDSIKEEKRQAAKRNEMMMLRGVGDGVTWMSRALSSKDMDFVAGLRQNMTDIFNRMCPGLLSMLSENATEANALAARATYAEKTLYILQETIAQKITSDILHISYGKKLKGEFDDPRVVDRKLELEEQTAFERSHTLEEVRREYYQHEPLGDERDKELIADVSSLKKPEPPKTPNAPQPQEIQPEMPAEMPMQDTGAEDVSAKAAIEDLKKWQRMALKGKDEKAKEFVSQYIPDGMAATIKAKLSATHEKAQIVAVFDNAFEQFKPKPKINPLDILKGIEAGVKALEVTRYVP